MNQALAEGQLPSEAQITNEEPPTTETPAPPTPLDTPLDISTLRTPLGEPIDQNSVSFLAKDPIMWHMQYWFGLYLIGVLRGEDPMLLALRIEIEIDKMPEGEVAIELRGVWIERKRVNEGEHQPLIVLPEPLCHFEEATLETEAGKRCLRDMDRMLVNKGEKTRIYLRHLETLLDAAVQAGNIDSANSLRNRLGNLYYHLQEEEMFQPYEILPKETMGEEVRNRLTDDIDGVHHQEGQDSGAIEADHADSH